MLLASSLAVLALPACNECDSSIDPVKCTDLCTQTPPHEDCAKCQGDSPARGCPQCQVDDPPASCTESGGGSGGNAGTVSGNGGSGGNGGTVSGSGGSGGNAGVVSGGEGGTSSGSGGTAGSDVDAGPPPSCDEDTDCTEAARPLCSEGECSACTTSAVCEANHKPRKLCDMAGAREGTCVECESHDDCDAASTRPKCFAGVCSECATHDDCDDPEHPQCTEGVCVECTNEGKGCDGREGQTHCDEREGSTKGQCLQCLENVHCANPTPQCSPDGECAGCSVNDDACVGRMDGEGVAIQQCNTRLDLETSGQCVHCTADNEDLLVSAGGCGSKSCNQALGVCTETDRGDVEDPCLPCVADSECATGMKCIEHVVGTPGVSLGSFCFLAETSAGCASSGNPGIKPYSVSLTTESLDGQADDFCLPPTSCSAYFDAIGGVSGGRACGGAEPACGYGGSNVDGALCISDAAPSLNNRCSYQCTSSYDCPSGTGFTACPAGVLRFCRPP